LAGVIIVPVALQESQKAESAPAKRTTCQSVAMASERRNLPLIGILFIGAIVRIALWFAWADWTPLINDDARDYRRLAARLVTTGQYANEHGTLISLRPPLYPVIVAGIYYVFGVENDHAVRAVQALLSLLTALVVYRIGLIVYSHHVALWAAGIVCFYPPLLGYANMLLSETVFTFFSIMFAWLICSAIHRQQRSTLVAAGITLGLAALTRSIMLLFSPIVGIWVLLSWRGSWRQRCFSAVIPLAVFAAVISPWAIRNTRIQRTLTIIDVMGGRNAMMGNYEYTPMERSWATISDVPEEYQWYRVLQRNSPGKEPLTQGQLDKLALRHALRFVVAHPWLTLKRDMVKFFNFWQLDRMLIAAAVGGYFGDLSATTRFFIATLICGCYAFVLLGGILGACCYPPKDVRFHWFLIASILLPCAIHTLIFAHSRYHLPVIPLLAVYAAAAIVNRREIWRRRRTIRFAMASGLCVLIVAGWLRELFFVDFELINQLIG
jgi:4-amino-4-deoxy-L-arabinose transferase-like glycosyltransferase